MKDLVLKICTNTWDNESRDKREMSVCKELGFDVAVLAKGNSEDKGREEKKDGFRVYRYGTRPFGEKVPNIINRIASIFSWAGFVRYLNPTIISGHDLSGLLIAWISTLFKNNKPKLVYDSHEFELGRNAKRSIVTAKGVKILEHFLIDKSDLTIVVNDSIADEIQKIYGLKNRPVVVRNIPNNWHISEDVCSANRKKLIDEFSSMGSCVDYLVIYHGVITNDRGIEQTIESVSTIENVGLILLGDYNSNTYQSELETLIKTTGCTNRTIHIPSVASDDMWKYIGAADVSLAIIVPKYKSYYYALPNKFFEAIQSLTPVIISNLPEMKKINDSYNVGVVCDPINTYEIASCINKLYSDGKLNIELKDNLRIAKEKLCWENEKMRLMDAYSTLK